nr:hypothetical protein [uncultured Prevotella sp.]
MILPPHGKDWETIGDGLMLAYYVYPDACDVGTMDFIIDEDIDGITYVVFSFQLHLNT